MRVVGDDDRELPGSPCPLIAFPRGLEQFLEGRAELGGERLRAGLFDRLLPQSLPATDYPAWAHVFPPAPPFQAPSARVAVALIGEEGLDDTLESLEAQSCEAAAVGVIRAGAEPMSFEPADLAAFLSSEAADADIVVFAPAGARLHRYALGRLAEALTQFPDAPLAYCDVLVADGQGREWPLALPAFDYERLLEQGYAAFFFAARAGRRPHGAGARRGRSRSGCSTPPMTSAAPRGPRPPRMRRASWRACRPPTAPAPPPCWRARPAIIWRRAGSISWSSRAPATCCPPQKRIASRRPERSRSSFPTRNRVDLLRPCLESLKRTLRSVAHEIFIVDNDSSDPETLDYFEEIAAEGVRIARVGGPFNFARLVNAGASVASGDYLLLLNNDVEALREGWLDEMLSRAAEPDVGAVGVKLTFPSGGIQHGGVVLGPNMAAAHAFDERQDGDPGYGELMRVAHETSAVTAACLLTPRRLFRSLGGFDATRFPVLFNDVDYCLRLRAAGKRVIMTPHARLVHKAGSSRGRERAFEGRHARQRDLDNLRMAWAEVLAEDPFYSPMLGLDAPYAGLAWPPRSQAPRVPRVLGPNPIPPGF